MIAIPVALIVKRREEQVSALELVDAYAGLADQVHAGGASGDAPGLIEAVYRATTDHGFSDVSSGSVEVRGWGATVQTLPILSQLTLPRFSPDGAALLAAERVPSGGEQYAPSYERGRLVYVGRARASVSTCLGRSNCL